MKKNKQYEKRIKKLCFFFDFYKFWNEQCHNDWEIKIDDRQIEDSTRMYFKSFQ